VARPFKEGLDYFPHDTDAVNDEKIEALRILHGNNGYAFYFILLERIYRTSNAEIDVSDAETIQILSRKVAVTTEEFMQILHTALKWNCFDSNSYEKRGVLTSDGIKKRAASITEKRTLMRENYHKQKVLVSDAETRQKLGRNSAETPQSKVKESIYKSKDKKIYAPAVLMTQDEHKKLVERFGEKEASDRIERLSLYKMSTGKKYKCDYSTILNWARKDEKEKPKGDDDDRDFSHLYNQPL